jgi:hypothetical protein
VNVEEATMQTKRKRSLRADKGAFWTLLDRAVHAGWGATMRLALLLTVTMSGVRVGGSDAGELAVWIGNAVGALGR